MTTFRDRLNGVTMRIHARNRAVFVGVATEVQRSVVFGSEITGAPGQPVDTGALRASWIPEFISPTEWQTTTKLEYAEGIENGVGAHGPLTLRSAVGGFHSVALTRAGFGRIVEHVARDVAEGGDHA